MRPTLDEIGLKHGTDKASSGHDYLSFYASFFENIRQDKLKLLEIGIFGGASLKMWREYFPNAQVVGVDINPSSRRYAEQRVQIEILDQSNVEEMTQLAVKHGPFDIVIEDGSHFWEHQTTSLRCLFPFVRHNGFYVVEDLHTNYGSEEEHYRGVASASCVDYLKAWADLCCGDHRVDITKIEDAFLRTYGRAARYIAFSRRCCLIKKKYPHHERLLEVGTPLMDGDGALPVVITAHVAGYGDVESLDGYVNLAGEIHQIQGLMIECEPHIGYRVLDENDNWSAWSENGGFVGSRGRSLALKGVELRLSPDQKSTWTVDIACRFSSASRPVRSSDGEQCLAPEGGRLCGVHVALNQKAATGTRYETRA